MCLNEFAGYLAVSLVALGTDHLAAKFGIRPYPFYPGILIAVLGLFLSAFFVRETWPFARFKQKLRTMSRRMAIQAPMPLRQ